MIDRWVLCCKMASIESLLQEWEKVAPKATDEVAEFVPTYGYVPFCNIKRRNLTTRFAGASPILGEALQRSLRTHRQTSIHRSNFDLSVSLM